MSRHPCMDCGSSDGLAEYPDGTYCFSCQKSTKKLNLSNIQVKDVKDYNSITKKPMPEFAKSWLSQYDIGDELIDRHSLSWSVGHNRLVVPIMEAHSSPTAAWLRSIDKTVTPKWLYVGPKPTELLYIHTLNNIAYNTICIVEDALSAIRVSQLMDVVSLGGTNSSSTRLSQIILQYSSVVLWLDGDRAGQIAAQKFIKQFKLLRPITQVRTKKDPKLFSAKEMEGLLND